jgi:spore germination protein GerM
MKDNHDTLQFRQVGKGFIVNQIEGMVGRTLTQTFVDQNKQTYVKVNGEIIPLTEKHSYLAFN